MILLTRQLDYLASQRKDGFEAAFKAKAQRGIKHYEIEQSDFDSLLIAFPHTRTKDNLPRAAIHKPTPAASDPSPPPLKVWPYNAFGVAVRLGVKPFRAESDRGAGDTIARIIGPIGGDAYKAWFLETFGVKCGCTERQEKLNEQFPYEKPL